MARAAVKAVAEQRAVVTNPGRYRQNIMHLAWNHAHFYQQLVTRQPPGTMDYVCSGGDSDGGTEYQRLYEHFFAGGDLTNLQYHDIADDLLLSCLLRSGTADGFVKQNVRVLRSFAQGEKGVAVVRSFDQKRLHSDLLLLPILSRTERQEQRMNSGDVKRKKSSTVLPTEMTKYLTATLHDFLHDTATTTSTKDRLVDYRRQWEEFLYQVVATEGEDAWVLLHAACSRDERRTVEQHNQHPSLWIATTCQGDQNGEEECCSFYKGPTGDDDFVPRGGKINE